jgi:hypothetical protein
MPERTLRNLVLADERRAGLAPGYSKGDLPVNSGEPHPRSANANKARCSAWLMPIPCSSKPNRLSGIVYYLLFTVEFPWPRARKPFLEPVRSRG